MYAIADDMLMLMLILLHVSLMLFFAGLAESLVHVKRTVQTLISAVLVVFAAIYLLFTIIPIIYLDAPF